MKTYWGDIHSHCAVSYGYGTPKRTLDNARQHLDFCSVTGHAFWPDIPMDIKTQNNLLVMHFGGFQKLQHFWQELTAELADANRSGKFVTIPSYEWHSMKYGDYNVYFNMDDAPLLDGPDLPGLIKNTAEYDRMLLPHHCAYLPGSRGTRWQDFDETVSPLVEIFSNHGCGESDDAYYDYYHTMGPRIKGTSVREGLLLGNKFGFYASTDTHDGYPGHYGHGCFGVMTDKLDRQSIWNAIWQRRTIASTGAKFAVQAYLDEGFIGDVIEYNPDMELKLNITGTAPLDKVELIEGAEGQYKVHRLPLPSICSEFAPGRCKIKIECGWGRNVNALDWDFDVKIKEGRLLGVEPCFRFSKYAMTEEKSTEKLSVDTNRIHWQCRTLPNSAGLIGGTHFDTGGTQAVILDVDATKKTEISLDCGDLTINTTVSRLTKGSVGKAVAGFCSPAVKIHRATPKNEFSFNYIGDFKPFGRKGFIYIRTVQSDGQTMWASPIWFE